jgi:ornithine carbamoyltransferase
MGDAINQLGMYQVRSEILKDSHAVVMHDMPIHSGYEIEKEVVEKHVETILDQSENRRHR